MKENRPTLGFVFLLLMGLLWAFISDLGIPPPRLAFYGIVLLVEVWALANKRKGDTISEAFWELSSRPLVPWVCGLMTSYFVMKGTIAHVAEVSALIGIQAHFFWQADRVYKEVAEAAVDAKIEVATATAAVTTAVAVAAVAAEGNKP